MNTNLKNILALFLILVVLLSQSLPTQMAAAAVCDAAQLVADVTVPDGAVFPPVTPFVKTWRLKNVGTCTWTTSYKLVFSGGSDLSATETTFLPTAVAPGATVDLSLNMVSPGGNSTYRGYWQLMNAAGARFGVGPAADKFFWVEIVVRGGVLPLTRTPFPFLDDFASGGGNANWLSGAGKLTFPGTDGDSRGFALKLDSVQLETGATVNQPTLLMVPQAKTDGYIQGLYPTQTIQNGDRFQATIGCQYGATACFVTYRIDVRTSAGTKTLWTFKEKYDNQTYNLNLDLSSLAGKNVEFFLLVLATGSATGDRALWVAPRIVHGAGTPPTLTPTASPHGNWLTYTNQKYQFQFQYPPEGQISNVSDTTAHIALPIMPGTNLGEKYLDVTVAENATVCTSPLTSGYAPGSFTSTPVSINGIAFVKESGQEAGAGNLYQWTAYSTLKGTTCISLGFVLHSLNPGNFQTPPPVFDQNAESAVFAAIMSTFALLGSPPATITPVGPTPTATMSLPPSTGCDHATFIADVNVPDGTFFAPNTAFIKTWRLKNSGACIWTTAYSLVFVSGDQMSGPVIQPLSVTVAPNTTVDFSVALKAPASNGSFRGYWQLKNPSGTLFGIGPAGDKAFWVDIVVRAGSVTTTPIPNTPLPMTPTRATSGSATPVTPVIPPGTQQPFTDDFVSGGGAARWLSGAGNLTFPGADGDSRGFALRFDNFQMETGAFVNQPSLLMVPQNKTDGYIQGLYPIQTLQNGDHFQSTIGCLYGATSCFVTYRIDYRTSTGVKTLWTFKEKYDAQTYNVNLDLSFLAGKNVEFFLLVLATGSPSGDRAVWIAPRIVHADPTATLTPVVTFAPPTATLTPVDTTAVPATPSTSATGTVTPTGTPAPFTANWPTYTNLAYQFKFQYPPEGFVSNQTDTTAHITLPFMPNTNLGEKYLDVNVAPNATVCTSPLTANYAPGSIPATIVTINGIGFFKESGSDSGAGHTHQWTAYSTLKGSTCISLSFVLHSTNPGNYATPPPVFDQNVESAVFDQIMSTFGWLTP